MHKYTFLFGFTFFMCVFRSVIPDRVIFGWWFLFQLDREEILSQRNYNPDLIEMVFYTAMRVSFIYYFVSWLWPRLHPLQQTPNRLFKCIRRLDGRGYTYTLIYTTTIHNVFCWAGVFGLFRRISLSRTIWTSSGFPVSLNTSADVLLVSVLSSLCWQNSPDSSKH